MIKRILLSLIAFVVVIAIFFVAKIIMPETGGVEKVAENGRVALSVGDTNFMVEVADTPQEQVQGLSGRKTLAEDSGMLFVFSHEGMYDFWMKDMEISLDFIWINNGRVIGITPNVPPEGKNPTIIYSPPAAIDQMLEISAGVAVARGIKVGDLVR